MAAGMNMKETIPPQLKSAAEFIVDLQDKCEARMGDEHFLDIYKASMMLEAYVLGRVAGSRKRGCATCKYAEPSCNRPPEDGDCTIDVYELYEPRTP